MKFKSGNLYEVTTNGIDVDNMVGFGTQLLSVGDIFLCLDFKRTDDTDLQDCVVLKILYNGKKFVRYYHPDSWFAEMINKYTKELK